MIRIGLVGCGRAGESHLEELLKLKEHFTLASVADLRAPVARAVAERFKVPAWYTTSKEMFTKETLDAVAVITSADAHCPVVLDAAEHRLHVLCEKPIANCVDQGRQMIQAMEKAGKLLAVTYTYRFVPDTVKLREVIARGVIGDLLEIRYYRLGASGLEKPPEGTDCRRSCDVIYTQAFGINYDCGVHAMDLFQWYAGAKIKKITAQGMCRMGYTYPDALTAILETENGVRCIYDHGTVPHINDHAACVFLIVLTGRKGSAVWRLCGKSQPGQMWGPSGLDVYYETGAERYEFPVYEKCRDEQYRQFARAVARSSLAETSFPTADDSLEATRAGLDLVHTAMEHLQPVNR